MAARVEHGYGRLHRSGPLLQPACLGYGGSSDSKIVDAQAGIEATLSIYTAFLSRCTLVHDVAYIEYGMTSSMEQLVIADEIIAMVHRW